MSVFGVAGAAILFAVLILLLREWRPAMAPPLRLASCAALFSVSFALLSPIVKRLQELFAMAQGQELAAPLLRAAGIATVCEITAAFCRDLGEGSVGEGVSTFGKLEILLISLPLLDGLIDIAKELLK